MASIALHLCDDTFATACSKSSSWSQKKLKLKEIHIQIQEKAKLQTLRIEKAKYTRNGRSEISRLENLNFKLENLICETGKLWKEKFKVEILKDNSE